MDLLWNLKLFKYVVRLFNHFKGDSKPRSSEIFAQLDKRLDKEITITEIIKRQHKLYALIAGVYQNLDNKYEVLKDADKVYGNEVLVNLNSSEDYGPESKKMQEQNELYDQIGQFETGFPDTTY